MHRRRLGGIWFACLGWFLIQAAQAEAILALARQALGDRRVRDLMTPEPVAVAPDRTVAQFVEEAAANRRFSSYPVVDGERLIGVVSLAAAAAAVPPAQRERRRVAEIMTGREQVPTVEGHRAAADVLAQLAGQGKRAMVVEDGRLVGVVSGTDVIRERALAQARGLAGQERPCGPGRLGGAGAGAAGRRGRPVPAAVRGRRSRGDGRRQRRRDHHRVPRSTRSTAATCSPACACGSPTGWARCWRRCVPTARSSGRAR